MEKSKMKHCFLLLLTTLLAATTYAQRAAFPAGQTLYFASEADRRVFWMEFSYDNEGDAICVWPMRMPATRFVLKSRDSQGFHFKEYTFGMEMQTTSTLFGNITGPTGRMV